MYFYKAILWDLETTQKQRQFKHLSIVNSADLNDSNLIITCSDDFNLCVWDQRVQKYVSKYTHQYQLTSCKLSQNQIYVGSLDNLVMVIN